MSSKRVIEGAGHLEFVEYLQDGISTVYRHAKFRDRAKIDGNDMFEGHCRMICRMAHVIFTNPAKTYYDIDVTKPPPIKEGSKKGPKYRFEYYEGIYEGDVIEFRKPILKDDPKTKKPSWDDIIGFEETRLVPHGKGTFTFFKRFKVTLKGKNKDEIDDFIRFKCDAWEYGSTRQFKKIDKPKDGYKEAFPFYSKDLKTSNDGVQDGPSKYHSDDPIDEPTRSMLLYREKYLEDVKKRKKSVRKLNITKVYSFNVQDAEEHHAKEKQKKANIAASKKKRKEDIAEEGEDDKEEGSVDKSESVSSVSSSGYIDDNFIQIPRMKARIVEGYEEDSHTLERFYFNGILHSYDAHLKAHDPRPHHFKTTMKYKKYLTLFDIADGEPNTIIYEFKRNSEKEEFQQEESGIRCKMKYQKYDKNDNPINIDTIQADMVIGKREFGNNKLEYVMSTMDKLLYPGGIGIYEGQTKGGHPCGVGSLTYFGTGEQIYGYWAKPDAPASKRDAETRLRSKQPGMKYKDPFVLTQSQEPNYYLYGILKRNPSMKRIKMGLDVYEGQTKFGVPHGLGTYEKGVDLAKYFGGWKCIENTALAKVLVDDEKDIWKQIPLSQLAESMKNAERDVGEYAEKMEEKLVDHAGEVHKMRVAQEMIYRSEKGLSSYKPDLEDTEPVSPSNSTGKSKEDPALADLMEEQRREIQKGGRTLMSEMRHKNDLIKNEIEDMSEVERQELYNSFSSATMEAICATKSKTEVLTIKLMRRKGEGEFEGASKKLSSIEDALRALDKKINKNRKNKQNMLAQITELYKNGWTEYRSSDGEDYFWIKGVRHGKGYTTFINGNADPNVNPNTPRYYKVISKWQDGVEVMDKDIFGYDLAPRVEIPDFQFDDTEVIQPTRDNIADHKADTSHVWFLPACIFCLNPFN